jgi:CspA family cold shock protein
MATGKVKWYNRVKGFGFIAGEGDKDVYVHYSVLKAGGIRKLKDGEEVEYVASESEKGLKASSVTLKKPQA